MRQGPLRSEKCLWLVRPASSGVQPRRGHGGQRVQPTSLPLESVPWCPCCSGTPLRQVTCCVATVQPAALPEVPPPQPQTPAGWPACSQDKGGQLDCAGDTRLPWR